MLEEMTPATTEPVTPKPKASGLRKPSMMATPSTGIRPPGGASTGLRAPASVGSKVSFYNMRLR